MRLFLFFFRHFFYVFRSRFLQVFSWDYLKKNPLGIPSVNFYSLPRNPSWDSFRDSFHDSSRDYFRDFSWKFLWNSFINFSLEVSCYSFRNSFKYLFIKTVYSYVNFASILSGIILKINPVIHWFLPGLFMDFFWNIFFFEIPPTILIWFSRGIPFGIYHELPSKILPEIYSDILSRILARSTLEISSEILHEIHVLFFHGDPSLNRPSDYLGISSGIPFKFFHRLFPRFYQGFLQDSSYSFGVSSRDSF